MKFALSPRRPECQAVEAVLSDGESQFSVMQQSLHQVTRRQLQREFMARSLASRDDARRTGQYFDASVHAELHDMLTKASDGKKARR